jgi:hypothetical protein
MFSKYILVTIKLPLSVSDLFIETCGRLSRIMESGYKQISNTIRNSRGEIQILQPITNPLLETLESN